MQDVPPMTIRPLDDGVDDRTWQGREPGWWRAAMFVAVLVLPPVSFLLGDVFGPDWQSGGIIDRIELHLRTEVTRWFAPLTVPAWLATLAAIAAERSVGRYRLARFAVYTGVPLTVQYLVLSSIVLFGAPLAVGAVAVGAVWLAPRLAPKLGWALSSMGLGLVAVIPRSHRCVSSPPPRPAAIIGWCVRGRRPPLEARRSPSPPSFRC